VASDSRPERTRDAARTKQRLLDAACDEFAEYGIAGGRVERIAAAAGCNKALIYAYFDSKDALFDAAFAV
jgi:AcrR family transcriptional regulator